MMIVDIEESRHRPMIQLAQPSQPIQVSLKETYPFVTENNTLSIASSLRRLTQCPNTLVDTIKFTSGTKSPYALSLENLALEHRELYLLKYLREDGNPLEPTLNKALHGEYNTSVLEDPTLWSWKPSQGDFFESPDHMYSIYTIKMGLDDGVAA
ncbi:hypothetical protein Tco_0451899 [Tanacetum coccineum]